MTDAEVVEEARKKMQTATDEAIAAYSAGKSFEQFADGFDLPTEYRRCIALDLRLLGSFVLDFGKPAPTLMRTQWVFRHEKEDAVYVVGVQNVVELDRVGHAMLRAFVNAGDAA